MFHETASPGLGWSHDHFEFWILGAIEPRGVGFETPNQLFLYSRKSEISFLSSGEKFKIVESAFIKCSRSSLFAVIYLNKTLFGVDALCFPKYESEFRVPPTKV